MSLGLPSSACRGALAGALLASVLVPAAQKISADGPPRPSPEVRRVVAVESHRIVPDLRADGSSQPPLLVPQMTFSAPLLYLAAGTTIRTTGSVEPYADLNLARAIAEAYLARHDMMAVWRETQEILAKTPGNAQALSYQPSSGA